jgi:hypothetical protein
VLISLDVKRFDLSFEMRCLDDRLLGIVNTCLVNNVLDANVSELSKSCGEIGSGNYQSGRVVPVIVYLFVVFYQQFWGWNCFGT